MSVRADSPVPLLRLANVEVLYNGIILGARGVTLELHEGTCVVLLGANGAGKSTVLKAISGLVHYEEGRVSAGTIELSGERIDGLAPERMVERRVAHVMEGRRVLMHMTVEQNLVVGGHLASSSAVRERRLEQVYEDIPRLRDLAQRTAGLLSGGEQQLVVIARALMGDPRLLLIDEPSLGLAPLMVEEIFRLLKRLRDRGLSLLLVEQNARAALGIADHGYVMESGRIVLAGAASDLFANEDVREFYLGLTAGGARKRYADIKHYRRRKRWLG